MPLFYDMSGSTMNVAQQRLSQVSHHLGLTKSGRDKLLEKHPDDVGSIPTQCSSLPMNYVNGTFDTRS